MKRRLLPILMTLVLVCALPIWAAFVTSGDVTNPLVSTAAASEPPDTAAARLKSAISNGGNVQLTEDIEISATLEVTRNVTLDLNGHVLNLRSSGDSRITVEGGGSLTIIAVLTADPDDSSISQLRYLGYQRPSMMSSRMPTLVSPMAVMGWQRVVSMG